MVVMTLKKSKGAVRVRVRVESQKREGVFFKSLKMRSRVIGIMGVRRVIKSRLNLGEAKVRRNVAVRRSFWWGDSRVRRVVRRKGMISKRNSAGALPSVLR